MHRAGELGQSSASLMPATLAAKVPGRAPSSSSTSSTFDLLADTASKLGAHLSLFARGLLCTHRASRKYEEALCVGLACPSQSTRAPGQDR